MSLLQEQERVTEYYVYVCDSQARDIFLGILYGYKAFLQVSNMCIYSIHVHTYIQVHVRPVGSTFILAQPGCVAKDVWWA